MKIFVRVAAMVLVWSSTVQAQALKPGDIVEYPAYGKWERGIVESELPGGRQLLVRRKPSEFYPKGDTAAYAPDELRRPAAESAPAPAAPEPRAGAAQPFPVAPAPTAATQRRPSGAADAAGLLGKEQVLAYAREAMGGDPWGNPRREAALSQIRDYIKARGTSFSADDDFVARMDKQGTMSSHIKWAVDLHRGAAPKVGDYTGKWALTAANRGSHSYTNEGGSTVRKTTTDSQAKSGLLEIKADGTYVWKLGPNDPPGVWLRGVWREAKPGEMNPWEAGPALWLERAKQGYDCMVRMGRDPAWPGWIEVGAGPGRTPVEFGRKL
jgi:hypothetical protein